MFRENCLDPCTHPEPWIRGYSNCRTHTTRKITMSRRIQVQVRVLIGQRPLHDVQTGLDPLALGGNAYMLSAVGSNTRLSHCSARHFLFVLLSLSLSISLSRSFSPSLSLFFFLSLSHAHGETRPVCFTLSRKPPRALHYNQQHNCIHPARCATFCTPCRPLLRAASRWIRSPPPTPYFPHTKESSRKA